MKTLILIFVLLVTTCLYSTIINIPADQPTIQAGINVAVNGDTVLVQSGTYLENINYNGKNITIASLFLTTQDTTYISQTIIDGNQNGCVVTFESGEDSTAVLCGFTITNGYAINGGGIWCSNSNPVIRNNIIVGNSTTFDGAGIFIIGEAAPTVVWNIIKNNNSEEGWGGGIYIYDGSSPYISRNVIIDNGQVNSHIRQKHDILEKLHDNSEQVIIEGKVCYSQRIDYTRLVSGGGILITNYGGLPTSPIIVNNTIDGNIASNFGGGIYCNNASPDIRNNIITSNIDYGVYIQGDSLEISFNDVWNNMFEYGGLVIEGMGNIHDDPLFVDPSMKNFHLQWDSPCIDAGDPDSPLDPDGTIADMGAFYYDQNAGSDDYDLQITNYELSNHPNPFNPSTTISFSIPNDSNVELSVYNIKGQKVRQLVSDQLSVDEHSVLWDGRDSNNKSVSSGIYFYRLKVGKFEKTKKMILMK